MTAPVTVAAPAGRATPGPASGGGTTDSAAPFASALDGALAGGRGPVRDAPGGGNGRKASGDPGTGTAETGEEAPVAVDTTAANVAAALWALAVGGTSPGTATTTGQATAALATSGPGAVPAAGGPVLPATAAAAAGAQDLPPAVPTGTTPATPAVPAVPATARGLGVDPLDPASAIDGAAKYLSSLTKQFGSTELALAAYNSGPGTVNRHGGIPPYPETQNYVRSVMSKAEAYR